MVEEIPVKKPVLGKSAYIKIGLILLFVIAGVVVAKKADLAKKNIAAILGNQSVNKKSREDNILDFDNLKDQSKELADQAINTSKNLGNEVLGEATKLTTQIASQSASVVSSFIIENAVGSVMKQINKLPEAQQEEIKKYICK